MTTIYVTKWALNKGKRKINDKMSGSGVIRYDGAKVESYGATRQTAKVGEYRFHSYEFFLTKREAVANVMAQKAMKLKKLQKNLALFRARIARDEKELERLEAIAPENINITCADLDGMASMAEMVNTF